MFSWLFKLVFGERFIKWIAPSFQGSRQTSSSRRVTAFSVLSLFALGHGVYFYLVVDMDCNDKAEVIIAALDKMTWLLAVDVLFILLLFGIVTAQHVVALAKHKYNSDDNKSDEHSNNQNHDMP